MNVGDINYAEREQELKGFKSITETFCDNIMVVKITDFTNCEGGLQNAAFKVKKDKCGSFNSFLRGKFSTYKLSGHGVKAKLSYLLDSNVKTVLGVKQLKEKDVKIIDEKYKNPVAIPYKIELADVKLDTLLDELPGLIEELSNEHYYLLDFDITQDFAGIFNKEEMTSYLTNNFNFRMQGECKDDSYNIIVDNS